MADDFTRLNPGNNGDAMDEAGITYGSPPTTRKRPRVVLTGEGKDEKAVVKNIDCDSSDYGLVVRNLPTAVPYPGDPVAQFNSVTLVPYDTETTIGTYTVPASTIFYLVGFIGSGDINGRYRLYINGSVVIQARTTAADLNVTLQTGIVRPIATAGQSVTLKVIHSIQGLSPNFDGTILGYAVPDTY